MLDLQRGQGRGNMFQRLARRVDTEEELREATQDRQEGADQVAEEDVLRGVRLDHKPKM